MSTSTDTPVKRNTIKNILMQKGKEPIVCLTAYSSPMATFLDDAADLLLVGDSLGMVVYGMDTTVGVTLDMMINHTKAVMRGSKKACVVFDMPFGSYQESPQIAFRNAALALKETGCTAVKLEGGAEMAETVKFLVERGIPVMGHVGLKPQSVNTMGGFCAQGKTENDAKQIMDDAIAINKAGAFSLVIEGTIEPVAKEITGKVSIPTIGIGASPACDGQILVSEDMFGLFSDFKPKFAKRYTDLGSEIKKYANQYAKEVKDRSFPAAEHCFKPSFK
ncbi:MAG: 3-methyl-2-oxobutanoate hydroxymethyltransferase [Alphaproteobacteria bacterium]|nr:3-methyl-2-oxobutanoate hydroxymethyltransferase [Alphaproteobacteria bacterium]